MNFYEVSVATVIGVIMNTYILKTYFPTYLMSKFASLFVSYADLGILSIILSYSGAVNFRTAKFWESIFDYLTKYIDFAHELCSIGAVDIPINVPRRRTWFLATYSNE